MSRHRHDWAVLVALLLLAVLMLAPSLFAGKTVYYRDVAISDLPQAAFVFRSIIAGDFPIWNPLSGSGYPQLAGLQPPFFYPLEGIFLVGGLGWLSWGMSLTLLLLIHYWLAGAFTYSLCRYWRWSRPAALTAAICFELSGYLVSLHSLFTNLPPAALLPLVLLTTERALRYWTARSLGLAALAFALLVSGGRPDITLMTALLLLGHALRQPPQLPSLVRLTVVLLLGIMANSMTLLPAREFIAYSNRAGGIPYLEMAANSFAPLQTIALLLPDFFGSVELGTSWGQYLVSEPEVHFTLYYLTLYLGIAAYFLALFARSPAPQRSLVPFLWCVWTVSFVLALGKWTPVYSWFAQLPLVGYIRYPSKFFFLWTWSLSLLAGLGMDTLDRRPGSVRAHWWICFSLSALALGILITMNLNQHIILSWLEAFDFRRLAASPRLANLNPTMQSLLPTLWPQWLEMGWEAWSWAAATLGLIWLAARRPGGAIPALLLLVSIDLFVHNARSVFFTGRDIFASTPPLVDFLRKAGGLPPDWVVRPYGDGYRLGHRSERLRELVQVDQPTAYQYRQAVEGLSFNTSQFFGLPGISVYGSLQLALSSSSLLATLYPPRPGTVQLGTGDPRLDRYTRVAGAANIGYLLVPVIKARTGPLSEPAHLHGNPNLQLAWQDGSSLLLYRNRHVLPRARFVPDAWVVPTTAAAARTVDRTADRLGRHVILVADDALRETLRLRASLPRRQRGASRFCRIIRYGNTRVTLENSSPESGFVILADNYYPGWTASVHGHSRPILLANAYARAVYVEAGRHIVEFRYQPLSFLVGSIVSLATALGLLALVLGRSGGGHHFISGAGIDYTS